MTTPIHFLRIRHAADRIRRGGVVAYPTEAVYGLGCDPGDADAVTRILDLKGRRAAAGLILLAADAEQLAGWIDPDAPQLRRLMGPEPGITWVVTAGPLTPAWISGGRDTVAVRISQHAGAAALASAAGMPIVSTSANVHSRPPARRALAVRIAFGDRVDAIVPGATGGRTNPSEIRDARSGAVLRAG